MQSVSLLLFSLIFAIRMSKYTVIGTKEWFKDWLFRKTIMNPKQDKIQEFFEGKLFTCRPCHTFWMSLIVGLIFCIWTTPFISLTSYFVAKYKFDDKR